MPKQGKKLPRLENYDFGGHDGAPGAPGRRSCFINRKTLEAGSYSELFMKNMLGQVERRLHEMPRYQNIDALLKNAGKGFRRFEALNRIKISLDDMMRLVEHGYDEQQDFRHASINRKKLKNEANGHFDDRIPVFTQQFLKPVLGGFILEDIDTIGRDGAHHVFHLVNTETGECFSIADTVLRRAVGLSEEILYYSSTVNTDQKLPHEISKLPLDLTSAMQLLDFVTKFKNTDFRPSHIDREGLQHEVDGIRKPKPGGSEPV